MEQGVRQVNSVLYLVDEVLNTRTQICVLENTVLPGLTVGGV